MKNPTFSKLQDIWDKKLKKSGFEDIEYRHNDTSLLKRGTSMIDNRWGPWEAKLEYYRLAEHFLNEHAFKTKQEHNIWSLHTDGKSMREIAILLNKNNIEASRMKVWRVISKHRTLMYELYKVESR